MSDDTNKDNVVELNQGPNVYTEASSQVHDIPFTQISNQFIRNNELTSDARFLLIYLISFAPGWSFNDPMIRKDLGVGRDKLERMFKELRAAGYVKNVVIRGSNGVVGSKRIFSRVPEFLGSSRQPEKPPLGGNSWSPENQGPRSSGPRNQGLYKNNNIKKINTKNNNKKINKKSFDLEFDEFWDAYPKKVDKHITREKYQKILQKDYNLHALIIFAICEQVREREIKAELGMWQPEPKGPAAWLNAKRWEDEVKNRERLNEEHRRSQQSVGRQPSKQETTERVLEKLRREANEELKRAFSGDGTPEFHAGGNF